MRMNEYIVNVKNLIGNVLQNFMISFFAIEIVFAFFIFGEILFHSFALFLQKLSFPCFDFASSVYSLI